MRRERQALEQAMNQLPEKGQKKLDSSGTVIEIGRIENSGYYYFNDILYIGK